MRSKGFVSAFFIATTSGHSVQKWKGKEMNRKNMKKLLLAMCVFDTPKGCVGVPIA